MRSPWLLILLINLVCLQHAAAQEKTSFTDKVLNFPSHFNDHIQKKTGKPEAQLTRDTEKYLQLKMFKKVKLQLQWDFLSYQQTSGTQAIKFSVDYNF